MEEDTEYEPGFYGDDDPEAPDYTAVFNAPDYSSFIKHKSSARAAENTKKVNSFVKLGILAALDSGNLPDAAALFHYGPKFAQAAGDFTDVSETANKVVEYITAPDSPALMLGMVTASFLGQLYRNHEQQANIVKASWRDQRRLRKEARLRGERPQKPQGRPVKIRIFKREITFHIRFQFHPFRRIGSLFMLQTKPTKVLVHQVFSNKKLEAELKKHGYTITVNE